MGLIPVDGFSFGGDGTQDIGHPPARARCVYTNKISNGNRDIPLANIVTGSDIATPTMNGAMSAADKTKLDRIGGSVYGYRKAWCTTNGNDATGALNNSAKPFRSLAGVFLHCDANCPGILQYLDVDIGNGEFEWENASNSYINPLASTRPCGINTLVLRGKNTIAANGSVTSNTVLTLNKNGRLILKEDAQGKIMHLFGVSVAGTVPILAWDWLVGVEGNNKLVINNHCAFINRTGGVIYGIVADIGGMLEIWGNVQFQGMTPKFGQLISIQRNSRFFGNFNLCISSGTETAINFYCGTGSNAVINGGSLINLGATGNGTIQCDGAGRLQIAARNPAAWSQTGKLYIAGDGWISGV